MANENEHDAGDSGEAKVIPKKIDQHAADGGPSMARDRRRQRYADDP
jgi:hypothetical protein